MTPQSSPLLASSPLASGRQAEIYPWQTGRVLKLLHRNYPEDAQREFEVACMAYQQGVSTPRAFGLLQIDGRPGIIFERVDGNSLLRMIVRPWRIFPMARQFAVLHHSIHDCRASALFPVRPALAHVIEGQDELVASVKVPLLKLLDELPDGDALLHGDFHPDNVMVSPTGLVIIDWPNAFQGCPLADVARTMTILRVGEPPDPPLFLHIMIGMFSYLFRRIYLQTYFAHSAYVLADLAPWEPVLAAQRLAEGIPGETEKLLKFIHSHPLLQNL